MRAGPLSPARILNQISELLGIPLRFLFLAQCSSPALATDTTRHEVGHREGIAVSLPQTREIYRGTVQAAGVLTVDVDAMALSDLLSDGSYVGRPLGRLRHGSIYR